jgi:hypothetical protein
MELGKDRRARVSYKFSDVEERIRMILMILRRMIG